MQTLKDNIGKSITNDNSVEKEKLNDIFKENQKKLVNLAYARKDLLCT